jgi:translation initiation factor IF-3
MAALGVARAGVQRATRLADARRLCGASFAARVVRVCVSANDASRVEFRVRQRAIGTITLLESSGCCCACVPPAAHAGAPRALRVDSFAHNKQQHHTTHQKKAAHAYQRKRQGFGGFVKDAPLGGGGGAQPGGLGGFADPEDTAAWLLLDMDGALYDDYGAGAEEAAAPEDREPKYVNGKRVLVNAEITAKQVRVQGVDKGEEVGVLPLDEARALAAAEGVDLVLVSPDADPPVARLVAFGKFKYAAEKATKQRQKASKGVDAKEVRMRPVTEEHDYQVKLKAALAFLKKGAKVKLSMSFSGRELRFKEQGKALMLVS